MDPQDPDDIVAPATLQEDSEGEYVGEDPTTLGPTSGLSSPVHYSRTGDDYLSENEMVVTSRPSTPPPQEPELDENHLRIVPPTDPEAQPKERKLIWGTNINV